MLQQFRLNGHLFFNHKKNFLIVDGFRKFIGLLGFTSIGFDIKINNKLCANNLLFAKTSMISKEFHVLDGDHSHNNFPIFKKFINVKYFQSRLLFFLSPHLYPTAQQFSSDRGQNLHPPKPT